MAPVGISKFLAPKLKKLNLLSMNTLIGNTFVKIFQYFLQRSCQIGLIYFLKMSTFFNLHSKTRFVKYLFWGQQNFPDFETKIG